MVSFIYFMGGFNKAQNIYCLHHADEARFVISVGFNELIQISHHVLISVHAESSVQIILLILLRVKCKQLL